MVSFNRRCCDTIAYIFNISLLERYVCHEMQNWHTCSYLLLEFTSKQPTPTKMSVGVGRIFDSVCFFVRQEHNLKTNDPKGFKVGIGNDLRSGTVLGFKDQRSYGQ